MQYLCNPSTRSIALREPNQARMAESVDALVSNINVRKDVPVRPRLRVLNKMQVLDFQTLAFFLFAARLHHVIESFKPKFRHFHIFSIKTALFVDSS